MTRDSLVATQSAHGDDQPAGGVDARDLAAFLDARRTGPTTTVSGVDALDAAGPDDLAFCVYEDPAGVEASDAGIVICHESISPLSDRSLVHAASPRSAFVRAAAEFFIAAPTETTVHPTAVVESGATVGERCRIGAHVYLADCVTLGDDCTVGPGSALGGVGFGFARDDTDALTRQVHQGSVVVGADVAIGANCTIDRAVFEETVVGRGTKLSSGVHLAHQVELGEDVLVAYGSGFSGGATIGDRTYVHPHVSVATDVTVGAEATLGMNAAVLDDVHAGSTVVGSPARPVGGDR